MAKTKRRRKLASDAQWCVENSETLTLKNFVEQHSLLERQYAQTRYRNIINKYLSENPELITELEAWKKTEDYELFWLSRKRRKIELAVKSVATEYISNEMAILNEEAVTDNNTGIEDGSLMSSEDGLDEERKLWLLFNKYKKKAKDMLSKDLLKVETNTHELLALTNILLITPNQSSALLLKVFSEQYVSSLYKTNLGQLQDDIKDFDDAVYVRIARIINSVQSSKLEKCDGELDLLTMAKNKSYAETKIIRCINNAMQKLPLHALKDTSKIGETELFTTYFDPILSELVANAERNTILRWSNKKQVENNDFRPDATITKIDQLKYGYNLGHGEVKTKSAACDYHALCHDLLRLGILAKDSVDYNRLKYALAFQIHGFDITFYLVSLPHHQIYEMLEIGHLTFPRSLEELASFVNLKTLQTLLFICETFWQLCIPATNPEIIKQRYSVTQKMLYKLIDSSRDRHRECTLRFEL